jgi:FkbM family methyltransferase
VASLTPGCRQSPAREPLPAASALPSADLKPGLAVAGTPLGDKPLYSQHDEELIVRDFFQDRRDGVFLDVGCASPIVDSNTYYLEKHLGWSGIAVDALPEFAQPWQRKRPRSRFFNFLVSDHDDTVEPFYRSELRGTSGVRKDQMKGPGGKDVKFDELHVPTTTLTRLLDRNGVAHVDFLSMDIEGAELQALAGFDIKRFSPRLVCIESKPANREAIEAFFERNGYRRIDAYLQYDQVNWYYTPRAAGR